MKKIAFIGTGVMGQGMARNLMKNGFVLTVYNRTKAKAEGLVAEGAKWADSVAACVADAEAVITIVGYPKDVEEVYFGQKGIIANAPKGCYLIDMTTSAPSLSQRIFEETAEAGLKALDAPVSGGDTGAKQGMLAVMVGGEQQSQDLISYLSSEDPDKMWQSNIFGRSVYDLIQDGLTSKLVRTPSDVQEKFRGTLSRVVNEGANGLICLII